MEKARDIALIGAAFALSYPLAFEVGQDPQLALYAGQILPFGVLAILLRFGAIWALGMYRPETEGGAQPAATLKSHRYAWQLPVAIFASAIALAVAGFVLRAFPVIPGLPTGPEGSVLRIPWRIVVIDGILSYWLLMSGRIAQDQIAAMQMAKMIAAGTRRVVFLGNGPATQNLISSMQQQPQPEYFPVGIFDYQAVNNENDGAAGNGATNLNGLIELLTENGATDLVIADPHPSPRMLQELLGLPLPAGVALHRLPAVDDVIPKQGAGGFKRLRLEDLLRRDEIKLKEVPEISPYLEGRRVAVTGAAGSVGGALVGEILAGEYGTPGELWLVDQDENGLFERLEELRPLGKGELLHPQMLDLADGARRDAWLAEAKPEVVFHAAAYKHVPLMEAHPGLALLNNTVVTAELAEAARAAGVERFVFISTDKAVRPGGAMGASKRLAERAIWHVAQKVEKGNADENQMFCAVRFGNVLGSRGSVVPTLQKQIERGGPILITEKGMTRYFMTGHEAASLLLAAGALGENGQLYLLDMGEPVEIEQLARDLVRLNGLRPDDLEWKFMGRRPGEKLAEDLYLAHEEATPTAHPKLLKVAHEPPMPQSDWDTFAKTLSDQMSSDKKQVADWIRANIADFSA